MFGDHHVMEVRRLLLEMAGVEDVYASSGFQVVEVQYDETSLKAEAIEAKLGEAGYLGELPVPAEKGTPVEQGNGDKPFYRHTAALEETGETIGFTQNVPSAGRPLWPCPGMGPIRNSE
jgi:hypothetical protein